MLGFWFLFFVCSIKANRRIIWSIGIYFQKNWFYETPYCIMPHTFFYDGRFYFRLRQMTAIPVGAHMLWFSRGGVTIKDWLPPKVAFHRRSSHRRLSSPKGRLPPKVVFHQRSSSTEGRLPPKVVFHWRSSSTNSNLPLKVVFHRRSSSTKDRLPLKFVFHWSMSSRYVAFAELIHLNDRLDNA